MPNAQQQLYMPGSFNYAADGDAKCDAYLQSSQSRQGKIQVRVEVDIAIALIAKTRTEDGRSSARYVWNSSSGI